MTDIDISKIKLGDIVKASICTCSMHAAGVKPTEFEAEVYSGPYARRCVAGWSLTNDSITILEHTPARPEWADALVVRDKDGDYYLRDDRAPDSYTDSGGGSWGVAALEGEHAPITVVLDADGNPPKPEEPEIEWLNEEDLNKLPDFSVVKPMGLRLPRTKALDGTWCTGKTLTHPSDRIAPARVIYIPEENR